MRASTYHAITRVFSACVALTLCAWASHASAQGQGFRVDRYQAPPSVEDGLTLQLPGTLGHLRWAPKLILDYAHQPLQVSTTGVGGNTRDVIGNQVSADLALAIGLGDRLDVYAVVPATLYQAGDGPTGTGAALAATALGNPSVGAKLRLAGDPTRGLSLALSGSVVVPVGSSQSFAGDGGLGARGDVLAAIASKHLVIPLNVGIAYRPDRVLGPGAHVGTEMDFGTGVHVPVDTHFRLMLELHGSTRVAAAFHLADTPLETTLGARYAFDNGLQLGGGVGMGLTNAVGVPKVRGLLMVGFAPKRQSAPGDRDHDGIVDPQDRCPDEPEDADGFQDADGCPDPDNDHDGIPDTSDRCPNQPETRNGYQDQDGCPDRPPPPPAPQAAPPAPPPPAPPPPPMFRLDDRVGFGFDSARLRPAATPFLRRILTGLRAHPDIHRLRVEGHASAEGSPEHNVDLSRRRAQAVVHWFVQHGIPASHFEAVGYGSDRPVAPNDTEEGREKNRCVELRLPDSTSDAQ